MKVDLGDLNIFAAMTQAKGLREGTRLMDASAPGLSKAVRRLEMQPGVYLLNRTTRSVSPTEAEQRLLGRLQPASNEVGAAFDVVNSSCERPTDTLRLNAPTSAVRLMLPAIIPGLLDAYPEIQLKVVAEGSFIDILAAGFDAGIRYDKRFEQSTIVVPIGPRSQRFATAAALGYLSRYSRPNHPRDLSDHACPYGRFADGTMPLWESGRDGEVANIDPSDSLLIRIGGAIDLVVDAAVAGVGAVHLYEDWLRPHLANGALEPALKAQWRPFPGSYLYYPGRRLVSIPFRTFIDFVKADSDQARPQLQRPWPPL